MWAILFDLIQEKLENNYLPPSGYKKAYSDIKRFLEEKGFSSVQGSVYFGDSSIKVTDCFMAVNELVEKHPWFFPSIKDIRILKIEDNNNLYEYTKDRHEKKYS